jgi:hypothetical protein
MIVREATFEDRSIWDSFVDDEGGAFSLYFDYGKHVHEVGGRRFIPLLVETAPTRLVGILPIVREDHPLYSTIDSGRGGSGQGLLLKRGLSDSDRSQAITELVEYVDTHCSRRCSSFKLLESPTSVGEPTGEPTAALLNRGFHFIRNTGLPCNFVLPLRRPFEETIWREWPRKHRQAIVKAARSGVVVIQDQDLMYAEDFITMLSENYERHGARPPNGNEIKARLYAFRDKTKLFVALRDGRPIVAELCHYTPSTCYLALVGSHERDTKDANSLCYKAAIEDACNAGLKFADLGYTNTESLAFFKERFRATRVPLRIYEKRYSILRTLMQGAPNLLNYTWHDKSYIWTNRRRLWDSIVHS